MDLRIEDILKTRKNKVDLNKMGLKSVPVELKDCDWIEELDIGDNYIEKLENLPNTLQKLHYDGNQLVELYLIHYKIYSVAVIN
jgi:Leucine-rich repeat (LRR) protein